MNKHKLISIFLIILIAVFATGCKKKVSDLTGSAGDKESGKLENVKGSLADVLKLGKSVKCTATYDSPDGKMDMVVYSAGKKSYSEMIVEGDEGKLTMYSIYDGEWMYTWMDLPETEDAEAMEAMGMMATKMKVSDMEDMAKDMPGAEDYKAGSQQGMDAFQKDFDYKCRAWIPDNSKFNPPSGIEFMDLTEMMKGFTEAMESGGMEDMINAGCAACEMLTDEAEVADCKAELNCK